MLEVDLQMFSEGGGDGSSAAAGEASPGVKDEFQVDAALEEYRQKRFGKRAPRDAQPEPSAPPAQKAAQEPAAEKKPEKPVDRDQAFKDLIKGDWKPEADKYISDIIQKRFKNQQDHEAQLKEMEPLLEALYQREGVEKGNLKALIDKVTNDDALYEQEALQRGIPVDTYKEMRKLQQDNERMKAQQAALAQRQQFEQHIQTLVQQGEQLKQLYPNFDLRTELQNPEFQRLTGPNVGIDVRTAFEIVHKDQLEAMKAEAITKKVSEDLSRAYASGSRRPAENSLSGGSEAVSMSDDPSKWDRKTLRRVIDDVKSGKKIRL